MRRRIILLLIAAVALVACEGGEGATAPDGAKPAAAQIDEQQAIQIAWEALQPSTTSRNLTNWEVIDARQVRGRDVGAEFDGRPAPGCFGPTPPPNEQARANSAYWLVRMSPRETTPRPGAPTSPTAPPAIPEPFIRRASFLIRANDGHIAARKLFCVIY